MIYYGMDILLGTIKHKTWLRYCSRKMTVLSKSFCSEHLPKFNPDISFVYEITISIQKDLPEFWAEDSNTRMAIMKRNEDIMLGSVSIVTSLN